MRKVRTQQALFLLVFSLCFCVQLQAQNVGISPTNLSFATVPLGQTSAARSILLANTGSNDLSISAIVASGGYAQTNNCPSVLQAQTKCSIDVTFSPGNISGPVTGSVSIFDSDSSSPQVISLSGMGVQHMTVGGFNPQPIIFGFYQSTLVSNNLATPITVSASTSGQFVATNTCPNPLPGGAMCGIQLSFAKNAAGPLSGLLTVTDVTEGTSFNWPLTGLAPGIASPSLSYNPTGLYFWNQPVGTKSDPQFVLVTNKGNASVKIDSIATAGPFSLVGENCTGATLTPYNSWCGLKVIFNPSVAGYAYGALNVTSGDTTSPQVVVLDGLAISQPALVPNSITFNAQPVGTTGPAQLITLTNYQSVPVHITSITASTGYLQTNTCSAMLNANSKCTIQAQFAPNRSGPLNGSVTVVHDAPNSPTITNLYGTGRHSSLVNTTQIENAKPGDSSWRLAKNVTNHEIEGFASSTSVNRGETISFFVNTAAPSYTMDIYRMGWYSGAGARRMLPTINLAGVRQPAPITDPITHLVQCPWSATYNLFIPNTAGDPTDWASGIYLVKLTESLQGKQSYMIFVVRDDQRASDLLFQSPTNTYQAYNGWGGYSLYSQPQGYKVSFDRPYDFGSGSGQFMQWGWENSMLRFLEREGYDLTYATDTDTHANPGILLSHKAALDVGHDEYWSWQMRDNWESARDAGINLGFFGSNDANWQVRYESSSVSGVPNRTLVCYKDASLDPYNSDGNPDHPHLVTVRFANPPVNRPEASLIGVMYIFQTFGEYDMIVANSTNWVFANTGLQNGDHLAGLLGYEADSIATSTPSNALSLTHSPFQVLGFNLSSDMTVYTANSGSTVVAAGSMHWAWAMDDLNTAEKPEFQVANPAVQQTVRNILAKFGATAP